MRIIGLNLGETAEGMRDTIRPYWKMKFKIHLIMH